MIRDAVDKDKQAIQSLIKMCFPIKSSDFMDCFFSSVYDYGRTVVCEMDNRIISCVHMQEMNIQLNGMAVKAMYLSQLSTHLDYRRSGYMQECMASVLDECDKKVLLTFAEASNPKLLERFGFQQASVHRTYDLPAKYFDKATTIGITDTYTASELLEVYMKFMNHFDGYKLRDVRSFERIINECLHCGEQLLAYRDGQGKICGYVRFKSRKDHVKVSECIYTGSTVLTKLLKAAVGTHRELRLEVSEAEHLEKVFPLAISRKRMYTMVRCGNLPLFNKLYNTSLRTSKDAYAIGYKPLYLNEKY
mgnify:FL=1